MVHAVTVSPLVSFNTVGSVSLYSGPMLDNETTFIPVAESRNIITTVELYVESLFNSPLLILSLYSMLPPVVAVDIFVVALNGVVDVMVVLLASLYPGLILVINVYFSCCCSR